ncbi:hypothetical protein M0R45_016480 [Rubus argutus]|uniref:Uncharacterized protein n=1 Tax=Rubus argutus TaxID=59490 RepID=A0AAW1XV49_RUBAR
MEIPEKLLKFKYHFLSALILCLTLYSLTLFAPRFLTILLTFGLSSSPPLSFSSLLLSSGRPRYRAPMLTLTKPAKASSTMLPANRTMPLQVTSLICNFV